MPQFTIPGLSARQGSEVANLLQKQLSAYNDLHLTLKHVHWNVVGPSFIGVHEMIDPQVIAVRGYADEVAERIAALGASPQGTPEAIIRDRSWDDYSIGRDTVEAHLGAVDLVYTGVIEDLRHRTGSNIAPAFYVIAAAVISLGTVLTMRETAGRPLLQLVAAGDNARPGHGTPKR